MARALRALIFFSAEVRERFARKALPEQKVDTWATRDSFQPVSATMAGRNTAKAWMVPCIRNIHKTHPARTRQPANFSFTPSPPGSIFSVSYKAYHKAAFFSTVKIPQRHFSAAVRESAAISLYKQAGMVLK